VVALQVNASRRDRQQRHEALHPQEDADMIDRDATLGQQFFQRLYRRACSAGTSEPRARSDSAGSEIPRSWTSILALDESNDASTKPA
jgi:hypothetical protein